MRIKKLISVFIVFALAIGTLGVSASESEQGRYDNAIKALIAFEMMTEEFDEIDPGQLLTRETAAIWIYRLMNLDAEYETSDFTDVVAGGLTGNAVMSLADKNIIHGYADGKFRPTASIGYNEFIKLMVDCLEYGDTAAFYGGYPTGYLQVASNLRLYQGTDANGKDALTIGEAAQIFLNTLKKDMQGYDMDDGEFVMSPEEGRTLLVRYRDIYAIEARVTADEKTAISVPTGAGKGRMMLDETVYEQGLVDAQAYLGKYVTAYCRIERSSPETVIYLEEEEPARELFVTADLINFDESDRTLLIYENGTREARAKISPVADVIYNGKAYPDITEAEMYPVCGEMKLLDTDRDNIYDVVFVTSYDIIHVQNVVSYTKTVYNQLIGDGFSESVTFEEDAQVDYVDQFGEEMDFTDIGTNEVLMVAASKTGDLPYYKVLISDTVVTGKLISEQEEYLLIGAEEGETEVEKSVAMEQAVKNGTLKALELSGEYFFYIDGYGRVVAYEKVAADREYGWLQRMYEDEETEKVMLKIFTQDGVWKTYELREKVTVNGEPTTPEAFMVIVSEKQMVRFKADSKLRIKTLDTPTLTSNTDEKLPEYIKKDTFRKATMNNEGNNNKFYRNNNSFSNTYFIETDMKVFLIPTGAMASERDFQCMGMNYFASENRYQADIYDMDEFMFSKLVVLEYDSSSTVAFESSINSDDYCMMVEQAGDMVVNDDVVSFAKGWLKGQEWSYTSSEAGTFAGIQKGDIIRTKYDDSGKLNKFVVVHRYGNETAVSNVADVNNAIYIYGTALAVDYEKRRVRINEGKDITICVPDSCVVTVYEESEHEIRSGTLQDLAAGNYVLFRNRSSVPYELFIYKR